MTNKKLDMVLDQYDGAFTNERIHDEYWREVADVLEEANVDEDIQDDIKNGIDELAEHYGDEFKNEVKALVNSKLPVPGSKLPSNPPREDDDIDWVKKGIALKSGNGLEVITDIAKRKK